MEYVSIEQARSMSGTRLILTAGVPGPWGEAAKGIFKARQVAYTPVAQELGGMNEAQVAWLGVRNAPVVVHDEERPRSGWAEILFLAERLGSGPSLIPADPFERALMMGIAHEIAGENGLGWTRRLMIVRDPIEAGSEHPAYAFARFFGDTYGYSQSAGAVAEQRTIDILQLLSAQLARQLDAGRDVLVGDTVSAADIYWATFANLIDPLPDEKCPMSADFRTMYGSSPAPVKAAASTELLQLRDRICATVLGLPFAF